MKQLVSSSEAANILGLSLQGIHYRIKKGQLEAIKQDGKTYVYVDSTTIKNQQTTNSNINTNANINSTNSNTNTETIDYRQLALKSQDDQITILKKTIKFMKKQYSSEIERLDRNQDKILDVFQSEVDLLKSAFSEMKTIYQIEQKEKQKHQKQQIDPKDLKKEKKPIYMSLKEFFVIMKKYNKTDKEIKSIILQRVKNKDKRFIYKKDSHKIILLRDDFFDLV